MKRFKLVDNILGWLVFAIAAFTYCSTIEPTASFWDCPEFITTGFKLEIGHPPGAPFFMLLANLFSQFTSNVSMVAMMVNTMNALLSALTILFLFWTISHLVRRLIVKEENDLSIAKIITVEASAMVGALIYTWSDTFWFSAVEGEVYAFSSAFTAVVFWLILKWEEHADEPHSDRWLVLIFYMTGLSIGVHLLNLLCIPAIVLVFTYRRFPQVGVKGSLIALVISFLIVAAVLYGVVPGIVTVGGWFELLFVNVLGCPFNTGEIIYIVLLVASVVWAIYETYTCKNNSRENIATILAVAMLGIPFYGYGISAAVIGIIILAILWWLLNIKRERKPLVTTRIKNTVVCCLLMLMIGYSSYAIIVVRSLANPPMDQNSPEDIFTLGDYLSRDQYGTYPLFYGQAYTSQLEYVPVGNNLMRAKSQKGKPVYQRVEKKSDDEPDRYFIVRTKDKFVYAQNMFFPRMWDNGHASAYESWMGGVEGHQVPYDRGGETTTVKMPTQLENLRFFFSYQCNFMYWRYFMWNFAGRQNDIQGNGELEHGNWITGIAPFDNARLGDQSLLPDDLKENKGHNVFYALPLLLGLLGLFWQAYRGRRGIRQFWVVFFLFFMMGLAIIIYLNQTPMQPRERDYAYAGSFYAFAIWCGIGVAAINDWLKKLIRGKSEKISTASAIAVAIFTGVVCLLVPIQMVSQTWDDHDRSGRYTCRDFGQNYLMSLQKEGYPIIFTNGDNDTFPLWYNQEIQGVRTDTRVCNLSYLSTDWYIDQMCRPAYDSPALPITWNRLQYCAGTNEYVRVDPSLKQAVLEYYKERPDEAKKNFGDNPFELVNILNYWVRNGKDELHVIPTDTVFVTIDKEAVKKSGMIMAAENIPDRMVISLKGKNALYKNELMMLEMIAHANWTRPIYIAMTVGSDNYMNLGDNFVQEGLANRITPFITNINGQPVPGAVNYDIDRNYDILMHKFKFGGLNEKELYLDETVMRMCYTHRRLFSQLALRLAARGDKKRAAEVLAKAAKEIPEYNVPVDYAGGSMEMCRAYVAIGDTVHAITLADELWKRSQQYLNWYLSLESQRFSSAGRDCMVQLFYIERPLLQIISTINSEWTQKHVPEFEQNVKRYQGKGGQLDGLE